MHAVWARTTLRCHSLIGGGHTRDSLSFSRHATTKLSGLLHLTRTRPLSSSAILKERGGHGRVLDGRQMAENVLAEVKGEVSRLAKAPKLTILNVGNSPASQSYIAMKRRACAQCGIESQVLDLPCSITEVDLIAEVTRACADPTASGVIVQLPLPPHINSYNVIEAIDHRKDVDGLHSMNVGGTLLERPGAFCAATPRGITELLKRSDVSLNGRSVAIVGRSNLVGKPLANLLLQKLGPDGPGPTVTVLHTGTPFLGQYTSEADVVVLAAGQPNLLLPADVRDGVLLVDVGINRVQDDSRKAGFRLVGDAHPSVYRKCSMYTPVPGGVGPMTVAMLLKNVVKAAIQHLGASET